MQEASERLICAESDIEKFPWKCEAFGDPPLVHERQVLRLCLRACLPVEVVAEQWFEVAIGCRNEYGLWKRADFPCENETIPLDVAILTCASVRLRMETDGQTSLDMSGKLNFRMRVVFGESHDQASARCVACTVLIHISVSNTATGVLRPLIPVLSPPIDIVNRPREDGANEKIPSSLFTLEQCRFVDIPGSGKRILVGECQGDLGIGGRVWDGCFVLLEYLSAHRDTLLLGKRCVELGSGTGLLGMGCRLLGSAEICLTDTEEVAPLIQFNVQMNHLYNPDLRGETLGLLGDAVMVRPFLWGTDVSSLSPELVDLFIMAEVVYNTDASYALANSLLALLNASRAGRIEPAKFIMAYRHRNEDDHKFFDALNSLGFDVFERLRAPIATSPTLCSDVHILEFVARQQ